MRAYSKMLYLRELISKEKATQYYGKCMELARARGDLAEIYSTSARYYQYMEEYERAVAYIDSAVTVYKRNGTKADFASIYAVQSWLYEHLGDYKNALEALRESNTIRHNDRVEEAQNSLAEMQTLFEVGQLELEKSRLANRMKFIALLAGGVLLLLLVGWSVYQYVMVRRLKQIRRQLTDANQEITRQSRRAMESEKMKTAFINSMCHEIRTPLNAIVGFSQLLTTEEDPEVRKEYNDIVSLNNGLLLQIISDVLDLSRIESGHADLVRTRFDLRTLCREAVETFRLQTPEEVVLDVEKGLPSCTVCQYRQGLMQILANFIRNALKFTPKGFVTVGFERKRDRLSLYVRDTGIGIPAEELDKIFERFYKVDTFTQGTGLGLSICKSIAEQMGAQIGVDSAVGEGSCFRVEMPIAE